MRMQEIKRDSQTHANAFCGTLHAARGDPEQPVLLSHDLSQRPMMQISLGPAQPDL